MAGSFHTGISDLGLAEDIGALEPQYLFVLCKAGENAANHLVRESGQLERNIPNARCRRPQPKETKAADSKECRVKLAGLPRRNLSDRCATGDAGGPMGRGI